MSGTLAALADLETLVRVGLPQGEPRIRALYLIENIHADLEALAVHAKAEIEATHGMTAEYDKLRAERDALLAGKWGGPWIEVEAEKWWIRQCPAKGEVAAAFPGSWRTAIDDGHYDSGTSLAEAKAAADAALRADGWWLAETTVPDNPAKASDPSSVVEIKTEDAP